MADGAGKAETAHIVCIRPARFFERPANTIPRTHAQSRDRPACSEESALARAIFGGFGDPDTNLSDYLHSITDNRRRRVPATRWLSAWFQELHMFAINHPAFAARLFAQFSSELFHLWTQLDHAVIRQDNTGITEGRSEIQACLERLGSCLQRYNNADAGTRQAMVAAVEFGYAPMQEVEVEVVTAEDFDDMPELVDNFGEDL
ncbi:hypothetical protein B0H13DRAFT_2534532 [Mycena leptocephala]|nr:hypothetical protein B0H13DRAFT_2534532 [Mycena leptocephala]